MIFISILVVLVSIIYFIFIIYQLLQFYYIIHPYKACLLSSSTKKTFPVLKKVVEKYLPDQHEYDFIELGSGKGNVSRCVKSNFKFKNVIGIEGDFITYLIGRFLSYKKGVKYVNKDILKYDVKNEKSVLYCYLFPKLINKLYKRGYFDGKLTIILTFPIDEVVASEIIETNNFQKNIYIYDFRNN